MDLTSLYSAAVHEWTERVKGVQPGQWDQATPCTDWSVRDLVNHVVGEDLWTEPLVEGATIEEVGDRFDGDLLGEEPVTVAVRAAAHAVGAVADHSPLDGVVHLSYGDERLEEYLRQLVADHLVHAWDLAAATGQDRTMPATLVAEVATWFADREEAYRSAGVTAPALDRNGEPQHDLLAGFGRDADWAAPAYT